MIRFVLLAGACLALAGCAGSAASDFVKALGEDHNPVCIDITFTTPWGTEHVQINRAGGCGVSPFQPVVQAVPETK